MPAASEDMSDTEYRVAHGGADVGCLMWGVLCLSNAAAGTRRLRHNRRKKLRKKLRKRVCEKLRKRVRGP